MDTLIPDALDWAKRNPALVISGLSLMVATVGLLLTHFTRFHTGLKRVLLTLGGWLGFTRARYKSAFLKNHSELNNIYLDRIERLDILATYVPLNVLSTSGGVVNRPAIDILLDANQDRIVILGDPGSGKTTLLKSFGVSLVSHHYHRKHQREKKPEPNASQQMSLTPIYVELRDFATQLHKYPSLTDYIVGYVLDKYLPGVDCRAFLRTLLVRKECVLFLDALDEVGTEDYEAVRQSVHIFLTDTSEALPTASARVVMTSRYHNFLNVNDDWVPSAFPRYHVLAPFSDDDIQRFLEKRASDLPAGKTPSALWEEIRQSNTLDLHRTPLILTVSLGLYKFIPRYTIPESIARFYEEITKELLQRHDFRTRAYLSKRNAFPSEFKLQFLREHALKAALRPGRFDEFSDEELADTFDVLRQRNAKLASEDREQFLKEILDNSGLLRPVSKTTYVFAHRSFHEYFAALQLSKNADQGVTELISRAEDPLWRQLTVFFAAMDHDKHDLLLSGLAQTNPELAGQCLAVTLNVSSAIAFLVVEQLDAAVDASNAVSVLGALSAICRTSSEQTRERALAVIGLVLSQVLILNDTRALLGLTRDDLVRLARDLAATDAPDIVIACITISHLVEDDPRIVAPLWSCLHYFVEEPSATEANLLVNRLLELAQTPEGFNALQARPAITPFLALRDRRALAYPLSNGLSKDTNLVTLLAWADSSGVLPDKRNGFLQAFEQRNDLKTEWLRVERELAKTPIAIRLYPMGLLLFWIGGAGCVVYLLWLAKTHGVTSFVGRHFLPYWSLWLRLGLILGFGFGMALVAALVQRLVAGTRFALAGARPLRYMRPSNPVIHRLDRSQILIATDGAFYWDIDTVVYLLVLTAVQLPFILTATCLIPNGGGPLSYTISFLLFVLCFWLPATRLFLPDTRVDLRRRSPLASLILSDNSSQLWVKRSV